MGMRGNYVAFENSLLSQIIHGDKDIFDLDPTQCLCLDVVAHASPFERKKTHGLQLTVPCAFTLLF